MRLNQWVFLIVFWGLFSSFSHAVKNRLSDEEEAEVRAGVRAGNFEELFEKVLSGKADELAKRKCYFAFEQVLWKGVRGEASIPFDRDRLEDVPKEIRKAPQVKVGPERPFNTLEKPLQTLRLMYDCYAAATLPVEKIEKHPSADGYPGKVVKNARSKKETLNINIGTFEDIISTGLYAPAGKPIRITVPRGVLTKEGSLIQIGDLKQRTKVHKFTQLHRAPYIVRRYDIDSTRITIVSAFGGLIYIRPKLPDNIQVKENEYVCSDGTLLTDEPPPVKKKIAKVTIEGAVRAPYYRYGVNSSGRKRVETSKYPAPIGEFGSDRFIYTMPAKDIKGIKDLDEVIEICNDMYDALGDLTGRPNPPPHTYRACVELDLNGGALYAGQPLTMSRAWVENLDKEVIGWGLAHETGHMHQKKAWTYQNGVEITVNIIAYYAIEKCIEKWGDRVPADMRMNDKWRDASTKKWLSRPEGQRSWFSASGRQRELLAFYIHLWEEFGWDAYKQVYREYRMIPSDEWPGGGGPARGKNAQDIERQRAGKFLELFSIEVDKDLTPYFDVWGHEIDEKSRARVKRLGLPEWRPDHAFNNNF